MILRPKRRLDNEAARLMTAELVAERDFDGEVLDCLRQIGELLYSRI